MKSILFVNQKGGVGKTLLADNCASYFEKKGKISFIDLDQQGGAIHKTNVDPEAEHQIIDTPGALQDNMKKWIKSADVVVIPTRCTSLEMPPLKTMMDLISDFDKSKFIIVFNCWNRCKGTARFINWFSLAYPGYKTFLMPNSIVLSDAAESLQSVFDYKPNHKSAETMSDLMKLIEITLGE